MSTDLDAAFSLKDVAKIRSLIPVGYNYAADESNLLKKAVHYGCDEVALELIGLGAPVNLKHEFFTPLGNAASQGNMRLVKALLAAGAELDARPAKGLTAIQSAACYGRNAIIRHLAGLGADLTCTVNSAGTRLKTLALLAEIGAGFNDRSRLDDMTALMTACSIGKAKGSAAALFLLAHGADAAAVRESDGMTALKFALWGQCTEEVIGALVAAGCPLPEEDFKVVITY